MATILDFLTEHHRSCDHLLVESESPLAKKDWEGFNLNWQAFAKETIHHFELEEQILFPAFEAKTGMTCGPTQVMRQEHEQVKALIEQMQQAIESKDLERAMGIVESVMLLIQQHNMKEEQILYPMSDAHLDNSEQIVSEMKSAPRQ